MKKRSIITTVFSVTGLALMSKLLGFAKQMVMADLFGATLETDLINLSQGFIGNTQYLLVQSLLTSLVTIYIYTKEEGDGSARRFAFAVLKAFTLVSAGIVAVIVLSSPLLACLLAPTYSAQNSAALSRYLRLFAPLLLFFVWIAIFNALLHANKRFIPGEMTNVYMNALLLGCMLLLHRRLGLRSLVLGFFVYTAWNTVYLAFLSRRCWAVSRGNPFLDPAVRRLLRMMVPLLIGYSIVYINQMVDKILVSGLAAGTVTALTYSAALSNLVTAFIEKFSAIFFPYVTDHISRKNDRGAAALTNWTALLMISVFLPVSILTVLCAKDVVTIVYARGAFGADSVAVCAQALMGYGFMFVPLVLREVYSRFIYAYQDSRRPMVNSSIGIACNIALSIMLCRRFGVIGVTVATSIAVGVCSVLNMRSARAHNAALQYGAFFRTAPLLLSGGAVCALTAVWGLRLWADQSSLVRFVLITLCGMAAYAVIVSPLLLRLLREGKQLRSAK